MPALTRWFVRTALVSLLAGLGLGLAGAIRGTGGLLAPTVLHLLVVGWLTQMVFGVAFWLFPKYAPGRPRGSERLGWVSYGCLNLGVVLRVAAEPAAAVGGAAPAALAASGILQWIAAAAFAVNTWPRTRER